MIHIPMPGEEQFRAIAKNEAEKLSQIRPQFVIQVGATPGWLIDIDIDTVSLVEMSPETRQQLNKLDLGLLKSQNIFYLRKLGEGGHPDPTMIHTYGDPSRFNVGDVVFHCALNWIVIRKEERPFGKDDTVLYHIYPI